MSATAEPTTLVLTQKRTSSNPSRWPIRLAAFVVVLSLISVVTMWAIGYRPGRGFVNAEVSYQTIAIGVGDVRVMVLESGTMESSENTKVKVQVEAILGTITANQQAGLNGAGGRGGAGGTAQVAVAAVQATTPVSRSAGAAGATGTARGSGGGAAVSRSVSASSGGGAGGGGVGGGATNLAKPQIRSFSMQVVAHQPLRPKAATNAMAKGQAGMGAGGMPGGRGGAGGGGRGGAGGMMGGDRQGSTKILSIVPEGSTVAAGDIVCELDSALFRDELQSQLIRWEQAKSWVDQARQILKVSQIAFREYRDGIYPQDTEVLGKYIAYCKTQLEQKKEDTKWAQSMVAKHLLSTTQLKTAEYGEEQSRIVLAEAEGMNRRLVNFTAPRLLRNLEAKISSVEADLLAQESSFQLEDDRKRKLERMIELCTLRAPKAGLVAYNSDSGQGWNPTAIPMAEGVTVRQGQTIMVLPNANKMRAKVRVNESKVSQVYQGQKAVIFVEAFPNNPMVGTVTEVTGIPSAASGPMSDVKLYFANVEISEGAFPGLRTGLSAQVAFFVDQKKDVPKIPIESVRWADGQPFVAVPKSEQSGFDWKPIELGLVGSKDAEITSGLKPGDRVIAAPGELKPPPIPTKKTFGAFAVR